VLTLEHGDVVVAGGLRGQARIGGRLIEARARSDDYDGWVARFDSAGALRWIQLLESTGDGAVEALARAPGGDLYLVGRFAGELELGDPAQRLRSRIAPGAAFDSIEWDLFAARLSGEGRVRWARSGGGTAQEDVRAAASLQDGSLAIVGSCRERARFSDPTRRLTVDCGHLAISALVVGYAPDGALRFARSFRGQGNQPDAIAVGGLPDGGLVAAGHMGRSLRFPRRGEDLVLRTNGGGGWIARLDGDGETRWARRINPEQPAGIQAMRALPNGSLLIAGAFEDGFEPFPGSADRFQAGRGPLFVALLDPAGELVAGRSVGQAESDPRREPGQWYAVTDLGLREDGSVWMAGVFSGAASFPWPGGPQQRACVEDDVMSNAHDGFVLTAPALVASSSE
jgi:hypothetical protein